MAVVRTCGCTESNKAFWNGKFKANVRRDAEHERRWSEDGWNVVVIWECGLRNAEARAKTFAKVARFLSRVESSLNQGEASPHLCQ